MTFHIGQEVTPIRAIPKIAAGAEPGAIVALSRVPQLGKVYHVEWIGPSVTCIILALAEFPEITMPADWFRPVVKPKRKASTETGMEILRSIRDGKLDPGSERERLKRRKRRVLVDG
jgi:hypothetical protein